MLYNFFLLTCRCSPSRTSSFYSAAAQQKRGSDAGGRSCPSAGWPVTTSGSVQPPSARKGTG